MFTLNIYNTIQKSVVGVKDAALWKGTHMTALKPWWLRFVSVRFYRFVRFRLSRFDFCGVQLFWFVIVLLLLFSVNVIREKLV